MGITIGGETESRRFTYGVTLSLGGTLGVDIDLARTSRLFDRGDLSDRDLRVGLTTLMANLRLGGPAVSGASGPTSPETSA